MANIQKIAASLWFDRQAEEAVDFYLSVFKNARKGKTSYYGKEGHEIHGMPEGMVLTIEFELEGQAFVALNGGPVFRFNEAVSFIVNCDTQEEIDYYWERLGAGGDPAAQQCGWLKDRYGLSWQVTPRALDEMLRDPDRARADRVMKAMLQMKKLDLPALRKAYAG
jgi:predicted 3-demethylubiquinone-9 3-methyltransferase (glyoxalase superfamily)